LGVLTFARLQRSDAGAETPHEETEEMSSHQTFTHDVEPAPGGATITVTGEMDLAARIPIEVLSSLALQPGQVVSLRMADVTFIDSAGLHCLADVKTHVEATGATLVLVEPSDQVRRVLELTSLHDFFGLNGDGPQEGPHG
jgi:anti-sigma B factor antagonist